MAVVFSALYFEAVVNELLDFLRQLEPGPDVPLLRAKAIADAAALDSPNVSIETRVKVLASSESGTVPDFGRRPYQDLHLLFSLRNHIAHMRPEVVVVRENVSARGSALVVDEVHSLVKQLISLKIYPKSDEPDFVIVTKAVKHPRVAKWAYNTAHNSLDALAKQLPPWKAPIGTPHLFEMDRL